MSTLLQDLVICTAQTPCRISEVGDRGDLRCIRSHAHDGPHVCELSRQLFAWEVDPAHIGHFLGAPQQNCLLVAISEEEYRRL